MLKSVRNWLDCRAIDVLTFLTMIPYEVLGSDFFEYAGFAFDRLGVGAKIEMLGWQSRTHAMEQEKYI